MNYTLGQIARITGGQLFGENRTITRVITDSRLSGIDSSTLFFALRGAGRDGFDYIAAAHKAGSRAFLTDRLPHSSEELGSFIVVEDTLKALQALAKAHRKEFKGKVVAITGSNGKTTVKEWFSQLWDSSSKKLFRSPRSYNSQIGVALSLLMLSGDEEVAIIEAGISQRGEMQRLEDMIAPDFGVITNIGDAHSENFASKEEKLLEKLLLFKNIPSDRIIRADKVTSKNPEEHNKWTVQQIYSLLDIEPLKGKRLLPLSLRLEVQRGVLDSLIINDSYSNDMESLSAALDFAKREASARPLHLIITDIEQSSKEPHGLYSELRQEIEKYSISSLTAIGEQITAHKELFREIPSRFYTSTEEYLSELSAQKFAGAAVLIKGARSYALERISSRLEERTHTTTLEVNLSKIVENFKRYEALAPKSKIIAMVKASSYGLGSLQISKTLIEAGAHSLAVAYADEGIALRRGGITAPIWVMNPDPGSFSMMVQNNLEPEIYSISSLRSFIDEVKKAGLSGVKVHIKLDTGMHRLGFMENEIEELCHILCQESKWIHTSTIFTHLAAADDPKEDNFTLSQISLFDKLAQEISSEIGYTPLLSVANSAGSERFTESHKDLIRVGIGLYEGTSTLKCKIAQIKHIKAGETIGYNRREVATSDMTIAIIPIGYADGLSRALGCRVGQVLVGGSLCDIIGSVCMDTTIIDITEVAESIDSDLCVKVMGEGALTETEIAQRIGTISYEVLTSISPRIKRLYIW